MVGGAEEPVSVLPLVTFQYNLCDQLGRWSEDFGWGLLVCFLLETLFLVVKEPSSQAWEGPGPSALTVLNSIPWLYWLSTHMSYVYL